MNEPIFDIYGVEINNKNPINTFVEEIIISKDYIKVINFLTECQPGSIDHDLFLKFYKNYKDFNYWNKILDLLISKYKYIKIKGLLSSFPIQPHDLYFCYSNFKEPQ